MIYTDHLHGSIDFRSTPYEELLYDLLGSPEVQRLRHMRLMNFDVPFIQDLATTKRFSHSIGTANIAYRLLEKSSFSINAKKKLFAAALIHDIGILPYGHLLETLIKEKNPGFSHEALVKQILNGTYHPTNIYHQILSTESLKLSKIFRKHNLNVNEIFELISPPEGESSFISADIDIDNLDNVHRMGNLLGFENSRTNLEKIISGLSIDSSFNLVFSTDTLAEVENWLKLRNKIYTLIIAHPECVAYNAFLNRLLEIAVEKEIVTPKNWYLTDFNFEQLLLNNESTNELAKWLYTRPKFKLLDYSWIVSSKTPITNLSQIKEKLNETVLKPLDNTVYFFWIDKGLISRKIEIKTSDNDSLKLGYNSNSLLISLISKSKSQSRSKFSEKKKTDWRLSVKNQLLNIASNWKYKIKYPEDFDLQLFTDSIEHEQLKLFK